MLWFKALHIFFVIAWFAGMFYLPRLFVYHCSVADPEGRERFKIMERRLFVMMTIGAVGSILFGTITLLLVPAYLHSGWMHAKLAVVALLIGYHIWCYRLLVAFREERNRYTEKWYRAFNELPTVALLAVVILVVVKPF